MTDHNDPRSPPHKTIDAASSPAAGALTPIGLPNLDSDITDELADHLALSARDLQLAGHAPEDANQLAHRKLGDVTAIRRRLWWIQKGDEIMLRTAFAAVLVVLLLAVAGLGIGGWRVSQTIGELGNTLATMNETQRALLANREKEDRPLAIRGRLYLGDKSKPASYASINVYSLPEGKKVDTLMADEDGRFGTSSLEAGHYSLLANLIPDRRDRGKVPDLVQDLYAIQSRPISVYPWAKDTTVELDVAMVDYGQVSFELAKPFPTAIEITHGDKKTMVFPALVIAIPSQSKELPIRQLRAADDIDWPLIGLTNRREAEIQAFDSQSMSSPGNPTNPPPEHLAPMFAGEPILYSRVPATGHIDAFRAGGYTAEAYFTCNLITNVGGVILGSAEQFVAVDEKPPAPLPAESRAAINVADGRRTHLRITPPADFEQAFRAEIEKALGDEKQYIAVQSKRRPVKLEVVGQQDLIDPRELGSRPGGPYGEPSAYGVGGGFGGGGYGGAF